MFDEFFVVDVDVGEVCGYEFVFDDYVWDVLVGVVLFVVVCVGGVVDFGVVEYVVLGDVCWVCFDLFICWVCFEEEVYEVVL